MPEKSEQGFDFSPPSFPSSLEIKRKVCLFVWEDQKGKVTISRKILKIEVLFGLIN